MAQHTVISQVLEERRRQDAQWGGPEHDDCHEPVHWVDFVRDHATRAAKAAAPAAAGLTILDADEYRKQMVEIAALAVAAVESLDRRRGLRPAAWTSARAGHLEAVERECADGTEIYKRALMALEAAGVPSDPRTFLSADEVAQGIGVDELDLLARRIRWLASAGIR